MVRKQEMTHTPKPSKQSRTGHQKMQMSYDHMRKDIKRIRAEREKKRGYGQTKTSHSVTAFSPADYDDPLISSTGGTAIGRSQEQGRPAPAIASISV